MAGHGGFDHNAQALRIVTRLEHRYASYDGLNLCLGDAGGAGQAQRPADRCGGAGLEQLRERGVPLAILEYDAAPAARPRDLRRCRGAGRGHRRRHRLQHA